MKSFADVTSANENRRYLIETIPA